MGRYHADQGGVSIETTLDCGYVATHNCLRLPGIAPRMQTGKWLPSTDTLAICLADAPIDTCEDVNIGIKKVFVKPFNYSDQIIVAALPGPARVNLLDLRINEFVMTASISAGIYEDTCLLLDAEGYVKLRGEDFAYPLVAGDAEELDEDDDEQAIEIEYPFEVCSSRVTEILIDFDLAKVLQPNELGNGYVLDPDEIEAVDKLDVGEIEGEVVATDHRQASCCRVV